MHLDASVVSRFLSGRRIPPRSFITGLVHAAEQGGRPVSRDTYEELIRLHEAAQSSSPYVGDRLSALQARNAEASVRIRELEAQLAELRSK
ncbi:hypothetical protein ABT300_27250 [Streptomyces sp. NPDC001027]|uniref:hypothetical protein n=1 Tax=Streptomyces sp. NPDC001027 TaxID=3154771 RepID=UPI0033321115